MEKNKIRQHLEDHKQFYIYAGILVGGVIIGKAVFSKPQIITNTASSVASPTINTSAQATNGGYMRKLVKCLETGQIWETVKDAAEAMDVSPQMMSRHLNGHKDHISDLHFVISGLGTSSI